MHVPSASRVDHETRTQRLADLATQIRIHILDQSRRADLGHIGSALSIADLLAALYGDFLSPAGADDPDRFVLSKGHAVLGLYAALAETGRMDPRRLDTYCADGTDLGGHPEATLEGIDFATGSLGHGLPLASGAALAARIQRSPRRVAVLISDAECNEGSVWEAAMFAAHHRLGNLVALLDLNGQQALGYTKDVLDMSPVANTWREFGWDVHECPGHDPAAIADLLASLDYVDGLPHMLVADTTFGSGVSYMESQIPWHYLPMSEEQHRQALAEVRGAAKVAR